MLIKIKYKNNLLILNLFYIYFFFLLKLSYVIINNYFFKFSRLDKLENVGFQILVHYP